MTADHTVAGMTSKAHRNLMTSYLPARRLAKTGWSVGLIANRYVECIGGLVIADEALVIFAVFLENVRLPRFAQAESVPDGIPDGLRPVRDNVKALVPVALDSIVVPPQPHLHERVALQHRAFGVGLGSVRHRGERLRPGLGRMALDALSHIRILIRPGAPDQKAGQSKEPNPATKSHRELFFSAASTSWRSFRNSRRSRAASSLRPAFAYAVARAMRTCGLPGASVRASSSS